MFDVVNASPTSSLQDKKGTEYVAGNIYHNPSSALRQTKPSLRCRCGAMRSKTLDAVLYCHLVN